MSGQVPPRRRRIAGERRPRTPQAGEPTTDPTTGPTTGPTSEPVELRKPAEPVERTEPTEPTEALPPEPVREESAGSGWWGSRASLVALAVTLALLLAITGLGLAGLLGNRGISELRDADKVREAEDTAPSVAERAAEAILAYDHTNLDGAKEAARRFMTPAFAEKYTETFTKTVEPAARQFKAEVSSEVLGSAVVRATDDRVRVLVFVDQTTVATNKQSPQVALNRVEFDMVLRGGSWLVDDITSY